MAALTEGVAQKLDRLGRKGVAAGEVRDMQPAARAAMRDLLEERRDGPLGENQEYKQGKLKGELKPPNWQPPPGGIDLSARRPGDSVPRCAAELKLRKTDELLWDLLKMCDALNLPGVEATYLLVGATTRALNAGGEDRCLELFVESGLDEYSSKDLFAANRAAWFDLLWGGSARPTSISVQLSTRIVMVADFVLDHKEGQLWCIGIDSPAGEQVAFPPTWCCGDWPEGVEAPRDYWDWKRSHWQLLKAIGGRGDPMPLKDAISHGEELEPSIKLGTDNGFYYRGDKMLRRDESAIHLTEAGKAFLAEWGDEFGR